MQKINLEIQIATKNITPPAKELFSLWLEQAAQDFPPPKNKNEICIRIIDAVESAKLNSTYRHKNGPTNILSFAYAVAECTPTPSTLLGDLAICAPLVIQQAKTQNKTPEAHWAHLTIHGYLHLIGYDHKTEAEAKIMEHNEIVILKKLGFANPYN